MTQATKRKRIMRYLSPGYMDRQPLQSKVSIYLAQAYALHTQNFYFILPYSWMALCEYLFDHYEDIQNHPHAYLVSKENLESRSFEFMGTEVVPSIIQNSANNFIQRFKQG